MGTKLKRRLGVYACALVPRKVWPHLPYWADFKASPGGRFLLRLPHRLAIGALLFSIGEAHQIRQVKQSPLRTDQTKPEPSPVFGVDWLPPLHMAWRNDLRAFMRAPPSTSAALLHGATYGDGSRLGSPPKPVFGRR